jgi:hypothetical protein
VKWIFSKPGSLQELGFDILRGFRRELQSQRQFAHLDSGEEQIATKIVLSETDRALVHAHGSVSYRYYHRDPTSADRL